MDSPTPARAPSALAGNAVVIRHLLHKGGPSLIDLRHHTSEAHIVVTGPGMLFERLRLLTSLSILDGCSIHQLRKLASSLEGHVFCGGTGIQRVSIEVNYYRTGGALDIGVGPPSMYQSEIVLRTTTGETFAGLIDRLLNHGRGGDYLAALHGVVATGHLEHSHPTPGKPDDPHAGHGAHGISEGVIPHGQITKTEREAAAVPRARRYVKKSKPKKAVAATRKARKKTRKKPTAKKKTRKKAARKTQRSTKRAVAKRAQTVSARKRPGTKRAAKRVKATTSHKRVKRGGRHGRS